jgi:hypothetical protein
VRVLEIPPPDLNILALSPNRVVPHAHSVRPLVDPL